MKRTPALILVLLPACAPPPGEAEPRFWFDFIFFQTAFDSEPESTVAVNVAVAKEDAVAGLVWWRGVHVEGDRIGWSYGRNGWTSRHWVWSERLGRDCEVAFNSRAEIRSIRSGLVGSYQYGICQIDPRSGPKRMCGGIKYETSTLPVDQVRYLDAQGNLQTVRVPRDRRPWWNALCTLHGGPRPVDGEK